MWKLGIVRGWGWSFPYFNRKWVGSRLLRDSWGLSLLYIQYPFSLGERLSLVNILELVVESRISSRKVLFNRSMYPFWLGLPF